MEAGESGGAFVLPLSRETGIGSEGVPIADAIIGLGMAGEGMMGPVPNRDVIAGPASISTSSSDDDGAGLTGALTLRIDFADEVVVLDGSRLTDRDWFPSP